MSIILPNIKDRVLYIAENKEVSKQDFFRKTGLKYSNFTGKSRESDLNSKSVAEIILIYPEINPIWLLTGVGSMENDNLQNDENSNTAQREINTQDNFILAHNLFTDVSHNVMILQFILNILTIYEYKDVEDVSRKIDLYINLQKMLLEISEGKIITSNDGLNNLKLSVKESKYLILYLLKEAEKVIGWHSINK